VRPRTSWSRPSTTTAMQSTWIINRPKSSITAGACTLTKESWIRPSPI
jgi:hypothetical protein